MQKRFTPLQKIRRYPLHLNFIIALAKTMPYRRLKCRLTYHFVEMKHRAIKNYLKEKYDAVIQPYKEERDPVTGKKNSRIWVFWWQGFDSSQEIIKCCVNSIKKNAGNKEVVLIDKCNYPEYVAIPEYIIEKLDQGIISIIHFSDILRVSLLSEHGGIWMDATIFVSDLIPDIVYDNEFYTIKLPPYKSIYVSNQRWSTFFLSGSQENIIFRFLRDMLYEYWKQEEDAVDYFLIDYMIAIGYEVIPQIKILIDNVPVNNIGIYKMMQNINKPLDSQLYEEICRQSILHKLNRRCNFCETTEEGSPTVYSRLIHT